MVDFHSRTVVVTGGARGMGAEITRKFVAEGARVIVADVLVADGEALADELGSAVEFIKLDVTQESDWDAVKDLVDAEHDGTVTALVNCAGIVEWVSIEDSSLEQFKRILDVNLVGTWLSMHVLGAAVRKSKDGAIINFSSTQGIYAKQNMGGYAASKWGVRGLTKTAALEFSTDGIRVNSIHPGPIDTIMTSDFDKDTVAGLPLGRLGTVQEIAELVWFIAAKGTFSTGSEFIIDGGILIGVSPRSN